MSDMLGGAVAGMNVRLDPSYPVQLELAGHGLRSLTGVAAPLPVGADHPRQGRDDALNLVFHRGLHSAERLTTRTRRRSSCSAGVSGLG